TNSYELCDNINSNNNSFQYIHGFKTIETPSKHYQSTDSLFDKTNTSTSTTTSSSTNSVIMNSSYDQLKDNSIFPCLKEDDDNNDNNSNNNHTIVDARRSTRNNDKTTAMIVHNDDDDDDFHLDRHYSNSNTIPLLNTTTNTTTITHLPISSGDNSITQLLNNSTINFINNPLIINHFQSLINSPCSYSFYLMMQMKLLCNNQFHSNEYLFNLIPNNNTIVMNRRTSYTKTAIDQSFIGMSACCVYCLDIALNHKHYKQRRLVASSGTQDARFVLFGTRQLDVPASQS
ncbi:unnamed protein product, partial [Schistosoma mattheei]